MKDPNDTQIGGDHYRQTNIQPWDIMEDWFTLEEFTGHLKGNVLKRLLRAGKKGDALTDYKKARHELDKLISVIESGGTGQLDLGEPIGDEDEIIPILSDAFIDMMYELLSKEGNGPSIKMIRTVAMRMLHETSENENA